MSKCASGSSEFNRGLISNFCGSSIQGLRSSYFALEPCNEYYSSKSLPSLEFCGDNGLSSLFGSKTGKMHRRQRRANRAGYSGNFANTVVEDKLELLLVIVKLYFESFDFLSFIL